MESEPVITSLILSDGVIVERGTNKVSLIGCFHSLVLPKFPGVYPGFFATLTVTNLGLATTKLALTIRIENEHTGHVLASGGGQVDIKVEATGSTDSTINTEFRKTSIDIPLRFGPVTFPQPGAYLAVVLANNETIFKRHLIIQPPPPKPSTPNS